MLEAFMAGIVVFVTMVTVFASILISFVGILAWTVLPFLLGILICMWVWKGISALAGSGGNGSKGK